uniref:Solute carrier family 24 (Sodium/potassium/calcium exchanger), member 2 n=1 Tax=Tetraselmis sp. GSL018 TaxID=582737 RepID=A0A061RP27_9CHLO|eukprot:CAMPEP_0177605754 /NCGR_PEP_ID=MMETSP0419_2-20121207/16881_1 /TAXON_ID=582737 /ORGANISM="Tetraselmis sp., Strain GSL018" /LENGTH=637 /DNA_ID=CAMNT_0019099947 /DNA_START=376 /DNA_END=2289 /DNA_ORIENTATION=-
MRLAALDAGSCVAAEWESHGGWLLEAFLVVYTFWGFYLVTDVFFLPAISVLVDKMHVPDDLAGATILGAALNSPELFSNLIGLFILKNPVGLGLVMGSFNFNILCITGFTALFSRQHLRSRQLKLEWRYLQRDAGIYLLAVLLLVAVARDQKLEAWECFALLALYLAYVLICVFTGRIARFCCGKERKPRRQRQLGKIITDALGKEWLESLMGPLAIGEDARARHSTDLEEPFLLESGLPGGEESNGMEQQSIECLPDSIRMQINSTPQLPLGRLSLNSVAQSASNSNSIANENSTGRAELAKELLQIIRDILENGYVNLHHNYMSTGGGPAAFAATDESMKRSASAPAKYQAGGLEQTREPGAQLNVDADGTSEARELNLKLIERIVMEGSAVEIDHLLKADARLVAVAVDTLSHQKFASDVMQRAEMVVESTEKETHDHENLLRWPKEGTLLAKAGFVIALPMNLLLSATMSHDPKWYVFTIMSAVAWLAVLAYELDWAAARVGCNIGVSDELIGMTVVAIGTSLPNVFAAVVAGSRGQVETSISQAFGSNIFDILIAFGLPYTIQCALQGWEPVSIDAGNVSSDGIIDVGVLIVYLMLLIFFRMRLTRVQGACCLGMYLCYLAYEVFDFVLLHS